jgi:hypothetical protein
MYYKKIFFKCRYTIIYTWYKKKTFYRESRIRIRIEILAWIRILKNCSQYGGGGGMPGCLSVIRELCRWGPIGWPGSPCWDARQAQQGVRRPTEQYQVRISCDLCDLLPVQAGMDPGWIWRGCCGLEQAITSRKGLWRSDRCCGSLRKSVVAEEKLQWLDRVYISLRRYVVGILFLEKGI